MVAIIFSPTVQKDRGSLRPNIGNLNDWMASYLFRILVVAIIFSLTVQKHRGSLKLNYPYNFV